MTDNTVKEQLENMRTWAQLKLQGGAEPPWAWYQYMKLTETIDAILAGMAVVSPTANLQESAKRQGTSLRLVDSTFQPETAPPHRDIEKPQLPM